MSSLFVGPCFNGFLQASNKQSRLKKHRVAEVGRGSIHPKRKKPFGDDARDSARMVSSSEKRDRTHYKLVLHRRRLHCGYASHKHGIYTACVLWQWWAAKTILFCCHSFVFNMADINRIFQTFKDMWHSYNNQVQMFSHLCIIISSNNFVFRQN